MDPRTAIVCRQTRETQISIEVNLDGSGQADVQTPIGFLTHMLEALSRHSLIDLTVRASGDLHVDQHHTVEDLGFVLGSALSKALAERRGISRAGWCRYPMDEALAEAAIDLSGRPFLVFDAVFGATHAGTLQIDLLTDFFDAFARSLGANLHLGAIRGRSDHHKIEAMFKAVARALRMAVALEPRAEGEVPSTKGALDIPVS
ncbi:MAG: imidazoleglycerol-phosphate dehydratase HisB [Candidatus Schekmanbacteria bacterium]|nr:imidazoleglycerol-phosphate dehydratase HisB [Candidatus Schekmanbacteria bacterium]